MYTLFLQNNATKKEHYFDGLENISGNSLYLQFELDLDEFVSGEYTYACFYNDREDCEYEFKDILLDTLVKTGDGNVILRDLQPELGLLRIAMSNESIEVAKPVYRETNTEFYYRKK